MTDVTFIYPQKYAPSKGKVDLNKSDSEERSHKKNPCETNAEAFKREGYVLGKD